MMDSMQTEIARFLAEKAIRQTRATYQQVGDAVGWNHPTVRGLGKNLEVVLHALHDRGLPPLTTILVKRGERHPAPDAMSYIRGALGDIDIEAAQREVFSFDWSSVPDLAPDGDRLPAGRDLWLTSFWGFDPASWGCIGFADEAKRNRYLRLSSPNALVAIYVTKGKGPEQMRGKVVGVLEVSHNAGHASQFIAGDRWAEKEVDPASRGKWLYAVQATRAWRVVQEDWKPVEQLFPAAYASAHAEYIGSSGVQVGSAEAEFLLQLDVYEVPVYGQTNRPNGTIQTLESALSPSRAIPPATEPYWVGETDGPKHLYILELCGDTSAYLGQSPAEVDGQTIVKVGFSRSPSARRDQIQSAYPDGQFKWVIKYPNPVPEAAPYSNARVAIAGEDAMKRRLVTEGTKVLGGEFFLAEDWLVHSTWRAGKFAAEKVMEG